MFKKNLYSFYSWLVYSSLILSNYSCLNNTLVKNSMIEGPEIKNIEDQFLINNNTDLGHDYYDPIPHFHYTENAVNMHPINENTFQEELEKKLKSNPYLSSSIKTYLDIINSSVSKNGQHECISSSLVPNVAKKDCLIFFMPSSILTISINYKYKNGDSFSFIFDKYAPNDTNSKNFEIFTKLPNNDKKFFHVNFILDGETIYEISKGTINKYSNLYILFTTNDKGEKIYYQIGLADLKENGGITCLLSKEMIELMLSGKVSTYSSIKGELSTLISCPTDDKQDIVNTQSKTKGILEDTFSKAAMYKIRCSQPDSSKYEKSQSSDRSSGLKENCSVRSSRNMIEEVDPIIMKIKALPVFPIIENYSWNLNGLMKILKQLDDSLSGAGIFIEKNIGDISNLLASLRNLITRSSEPMFEHINSLFINEDFNLIFFYKSFFDNEILYFFYKNIPHETEDMRSKMNNPNVPRRPDRAITKFLLPRHENRSIDEEQNIFEGVNDYYLYHEDTFRKIKDNLIIDFLKKLSSPFMSLVIYIAIDKYLLKEIHPTVYAFFKNRIKSIEENFKSELIEKFRKELESFKKKSATNNLIIDTEFSDEELLEAIKKDLEPRLPNSPKSGIEKFFEIFLIDSNSNNYHIIPKNLLNLIFPGESKKKQSDTSDSLSLHTIKRIEFTKKLEDIKKSLKREVSRLKENRPSAECPNLSEEVRKHLSLNKELENILIEKIEKIEKKIEEEKNIEEKKNIEEEKKREDLLDTSSISSISNKEEEPKEESSFYSMLNSKDENNEKDDVSDISSINSSFSSLNKIEEQPNLTKLKNEYKELKKIMQRIEIEIATNKGSLTTLYNFENITSDISKKISYLEDQNENLKEKLCFYEKDCKERKVELKRLKKEIEDINNLKLSFSKSKVYFDQESESKV
jgi:hypothetical protein